MKFSNSHYNCFCLVTLLILLSSRCGVKNVSAKSITSAQMLQPTNEDYERLRNFGSKASSSYVNETLRDEIYERKRLLQSKSQPLLAASFGGKPGFYHGVASGDPLHDAVILWTRYTPVASTDVVTLELRISPVVPGLNINDHLNPTTNSEKLVRTLISVTNSSDWIAKIDLIGLASNTNYVFGFSDGTTSSPIGQTKTAPDTNSNVASMTYAVFSCSNFPNGYFHAYDVASTIKDLDFWIHVGDYIYEYGTYRGSSASPERKAQILPLWEVIDVQDYRLRHAVYNTDIGLQNLRRRAPLIAVWDDHETTNNSYGQGTVENSGAQNHQPICPVDEFANNTEKSNAQCDRDEGPIDVRFTNAVQAYMEWMPIRRGPGTMGLVTITSITQVIEWGNLATIAAFDTRISYRSKTPTVGNFFTYFDLALTEKNVRRYNKSPLKEKFAESAAKVQAEIFNPEYTMIGENIEILRSAFSASKAAGKPWQIWAGATMMGPLVGPNLLTASSLASLLARPLVRLYFGIVLRTTAAALGRVLVAMAQTSTPLNSDDFNGFGAERAEILKIAKENANNAVILGGDLHDSWAWTLNEGGTIGGTPVAINLGCPGVSSSGIGASFYPFLQPIQALLGGENGAYRFIDKLFYRENPDLVYTNTRDKGFFAVKATAGSHVTEYFLVSQTTLLQNYSTAYAESGNITASFYCGSSLVTTAGKKGSLVKNAECSAIEFETTRPVQWNIPFPPSSTEGLPTLVGCDYNACTYVP